MPLLNSSPIGASPEQYQAHVSALSDVSVMCFVPKNSFESIDYAAKTAVIDSFVSENSKRVDGIVEAMLAD